MPEINLDLDLHFLPDWAQEPPSVNRFSGFEGKPEEKRPGGKGKKQPEKKPPGRKPRKAPDGKPAQAADARKKRDPKHRDKRKHENIPLPDIDINFIPEELGVESLSRQIHLTGRAYPLFDIARLIIKKPERYKLLFKTIQNNEGRPAQQLYHCSIDDTIWLSEDEAVNHVLNKHFSTFYQTEQIPVDPPKGVFTFVAQCGMSGEILGPPNYHDYQNKLHKIHMERFSHLPFEVYKSRVRIVRDEETVQKWVEDQSHKDEYICLNVPEPLRLTNMDAVRKHFRENHMQHVIHPVETYMLSGTKVGTIRHRGLQALFRNTLDQQKRFPLKVVHVLSQQFSSFGLQFFKVDKTITHVSVARPRYLDVETTPVSEDVKKIIKFILDNPKCTRRELFQELAPQALEQHAPKHQQHQQQPDEPPEQAEPQDKESSVEPEEEQSESTSASNQDTDPAKPYADPAANNIVSDLHWLIHQGHVIEFANGILEVAKRPAPKQQKQQKPKQQSDREKASEKTSRDNTQSEKKSIESHEERPEPNQTPETQSKLVDGTSPEMHEAQTHDSSNAEHAHAISNNPGAEQTEQANRQTQESEQISQPQNHANPETEAGAENEKQPESDQHTDEPRNQSEADDNETRGDTPQS